HLQREAEHAAAELTRLAGAMAKADPKAGEAATQAAESVRSAAEAMKAAVADGRKSQQEAMAAAQEHAAMALEQAATRSADSARRPGHAPESGGAGLGAALEMAQRAMRQAREDLGQGKPAGAEAQMRRAAGALGQAAESEPGPGGKPGRSTPGGATPGGND